MTSLKVSREDWRTDRHHFDVPKMVQYLMADRDF